MMMKRFVPIALALLLMLAPQARAEDRTPDRLSRIKESTTHLGKRLAPKSKYWDRSLSPIDWNSIRRTIESSDAEKDARADGDAGRIGLMMGGDLKMLAPGLRCPYAELRDRAVFILRTHRYANKAHRKAVHAFYAYARAYNLYVFKSGLPGETSCEIDPRRWRG